MTVPAIIRPERPEDAPAIAALIAPAFAGHPHSDGSEPAIVERLRAAGELTVSLVAVADGEIVGHVAFSPVTISDGATDWYGLGPVAVRAGWRGAGIAAALIRAGLGALPQPNGCVVLGDPAYYARFGFAHDPALAYPGPPAAAFQRLVLKGAAPRGVVRYAPAFD